jgi:two-component system response regulator WspF
MQTSPCRILLLDAPEASRFSEVFEALGSGAIDVVPMPDEVTWSRPESWRGLLERIQTLRKLAGEGSAKSALQERMTARVGASGMTPVVAIGASTGGPKALEILLSRLPGDFPAAVVIVQHLDVQFMPGLATTLNRCSALPVKALTGETLLRPGEVWLAARDAHLLVDRARRLAWSDQWAERICRPSIDIFFESLAGQNGVTGCGVLLTGMGRDGAAGLLALRQAGFHTCAQDEASSVVYGMPKVAAQMGAAERILPLPAIADWLVETLKSGRADARSTPMMPKTDLPHEP